MKKLCFILTCAFILISFKASAQEDVITFSSGSLPDSHQSQIISKLLTEAFARNNFLFETKHFPSSRSLKMSNSGKVHGELHRVYDFHKVSQGKYPNLVRVESKLMSVYLAIFGTSKSAPIKSWKDLNGYKVGYLRGRKNVDKYLKNNLLDTNNVFPQNTEEQLFQMLLRDRLDYVVSESYYGAKIINEDPKFKPIKEICIILKTDIYAYLNINYTRFAPMLVKTLKQMKMDGSFQRIINGDTSQSN